MIEQTRMQTAIPEERRRDERSMRVMEYAMALMAFAAALLLSLR